MKGFMHRRGDARELRAYLGTDPVTGKQRYATRTVRGGKREAQRALNEMVTDADRGPSVRTNASAGEPIEAWCEHAARWVVETRSTFGPLVPYPKGPASVGHASGSS
jgi:integrase